MQAVLGLDQAWSASNPSGVALVCSDTPGQWHYVSAAPTYQDFFALAENRPIDWNKPRKGDSSDTDRLLQAAARLLGGHEVSIIAIDMPLSRKPIARRRVADDQISRTFGAAGCAAHSPTSTNPGPESQRLRDDLSRLNYPLAVDRQQHHCLIEVYPHPALLRLLNLRYRLEYKVEKTNDYWPHLKGRENIPQRVACLIRNLRRIHNALQNLFAGLPQFCEISPDKRTIASLKAYEDGLDALVCAWVGICYLENRIDPFGDSDAVIWVPPPDALA